VLENNPEKHDGAVGERLTTLWHIFYPLHLPCPTTGGWLNPNPY